MLHAGSFTKENGKRKRSLGCARDDETRKCLYPFFLFCGSQPPPPSGHLLPEEGGRYENAAFPLLSFRANARNLFRLRSGKRCGERGHGKHRTPKQLGITVLHADSFTKENENGKRKRSLGCARDDETRKYLYPFFLFCGSQPPPLRDTSFQRKEGDTRMPPKGCP